jgi:hypothetical protein
MPNRDQGGPWECSGILIISGAICWRCGSRQRMRNIVLRDLKMFLAGSAVLISGQGAELRSGFPYFCKDV